MEINPITLGDLLEQERYQEYYNRHLQEMTDRIEEIYDQNDVPVPPDLKERAKEAVRIYADDDIRMKCWNDAIESVCEIPEEEVR